MPHAQVLVCVCRYQRPVPFLLSVLQAQFSSQSMETITKDTDRDFFMSPQEAIEYGLIDAIIAKPLLLQTRELIVPALAA